MIGPGGLLLEDLSPICNLGPVYDWPIIMIGPGGLLLEDLSPICNPRFSFLGMVVKKENPKLGCKKYFCRVTY